MNLADLGRRIRAARLARRLTLEEVVSRTAFTVSWLSKLENGLLKPSLEGLVELAEVLGCGVEQFVAGLTVPPRMVVNRKAKERPARNGRTGTTVEQLAADWPNRRMRPDILHVGASREARYDSHDGERFLFVLEGVVTILYGDEPINLGQGDGVYIDASTPHSITAAKAAGARVLSVAFEPDGGPANGPQPRAAVRPVQRAPRG